MLRIASYCLLTSRVSPKCAGVFTKVYGRVLAPGLAELDPRLPTDLANRSELARTWRQLDHRLDQFTNEALTAA